MCTHIIYIHIINKINYINCFKCTNIDVHICRCICTTFTFGHNLVCTTINMHIHIYIHTRAHMLSRPLIRQYSNKLDESNLKLLRQKARRDSSRIQKPNTKSTQAKKYMDPPKWWIGTCPTPWSCTDPTILH